MSARNYVLFVGLLFGAQQARALGSPPPPPQPPPAPPPQPGPAGVFKKVTIVILENETKENAAKQPFMAELMKRGSSFQNFKAETHPSQGNYIAMTSGSTNGVTNDNNYNLDVPHIGDLLEAKGLSWKVYAEGYPGNCFLGASSGPYVRKHTPFLSYKNVQNNPERCARVVEASEFERDINRGTLPEYSFYVPDLNNDGHDTGVAYADRWLKASFGARLKDPAFMDGMLFVVTFDENNSKVAGNGIYTVFMGDMVKADFVSQKSYNHYSLLRMIEDNFALGSLNKNDAKASGITEVWIEP